MYQLCGTKRYVWIKLCAKVDGFSLIFSLMQKVNGGYWRLNCNEKVLLFYIEMWKCSIFYRKNDKTIEFKSLCPCQNRQSSQEGCRFYWFLHQDPRYAHGYGILLVRYPSLLCRKYAARAAGFWGGRRSVGERTRKEAEEWKICLTSARICDNISEQSKDSKCASGGIGRLARFRF